MRIKVKMCGLMSAADVAAAIAAEADYLGFVLAKSRRQVEPADVAAWLRSASITGAHKRPEPVLVLVDETEAAIARLAQITGVSHVQLCGNEPVDTCKRLRDLYNMTVWKAWGVRGTTEDLLLAEYAPYVDGIVLDAYRPGQHGGTGHVFPWDAVARLHTLIGTTPLIVAGGLTVDSVGRLLEDHRPDAVDVSSGIETAGGKDAQKMRAFIAKVRSVADVSG